MKKRLIGFAGEMGSGKGVATELLKTWFPGTPSYRFSDSLREFYAWIAGEFLAPYGLKLPDLARTRDLQDISTAVRRIFGENSLERAIIARVARSDAPSPFIVIEGIRRVVDISTLTKDPSVDFTLYYIEAEPEVRHLRHKLRNEKPGDAELSFDEFLKLGEAEAESEIRLLRSCASCVITNNGTMAEFTDKLWSALPPTVSPPGHGLTSS